MLLWANYTRPDCCYVSIRIVVPCLTYFHNTLYGILGIRMQYSASNPNSKAVHKATLETRNERNPTVVEHHETWILATKYNGRST